MAVGSSRPAHADEETPSSREHKICAELRDAGKFAEAVPHCRATYDTLPDDTGEPTLNSRSLIVFDIFHTYREFYEAYANYHTLMDFTEGLLRHSAEEALGTSKFQYQGRELDLGKPFERLTIVQAIRKHHPGFSEAELSDAEWLKRKIKDFGEAIKPGGLGSLQLQLFEACAEAELWDPTFIIDYPAEVSPLARRSDSNPEITERFELFIVGREIANGFSELNDPEDQELRFREQAKAKEAGDEEAMYYDADYIRTLEYGLPPTGGCGIGIDRLVMLLTDSPNIRDVILFPQMRRD